METYDLDKVFSGLLGSSCQEPAKQIEALLQWRKEWSELVPGLVESHGQFFPFVNTHLIRKVVDMVDDMVAQISIRRLVDVV